jgi:hypothetical protein
MADLVFNIAKGAVAEKVRDSATVLLVLLLTVTEADDTVRDHDELNALLGAAGNTEATFTNYARKTGLTATITVDDTNDRVDVDLPDQTWSSAGNGSNETMTDLIVAYEESGSDAGRVPLTLHDFVVTTDGSNLTVQFNASGFFRAA